MEQTGAQLSRHAPTDLDCADLIDHTSAALDRYVPWVDWLAAIGSDEAHGSG
jgi:hypothetical protein